jgi:hypothetical protein
MPDAIKALQRALNRHSEREGNRPPIRRGVVLSKVVRRISMKESDDRATALDTPVDFVDTEMGFRTASGESGGLTTARQQRRTAVRGGGTRRADWRHMLSGRLRA